MPRWRNWFTRTTQNRVGFIPCGFESHPRHMSETEKETLAYVVGVAIGDGNLSNPNGRATRLRITCDKKYSLLIDRIRKAIQVVLPQNKVSLQHRTETYLDISCYSNKWEGLLGWKVGQGSKYDQNVSVPTWIKQNKKYSTYCLKGLLETDGCIYMDRGYKMVNFVTIIPDLAHDVMSIISDLGFRAHLYDMQPKGFNCKRRYNIRVSKNVENFIQEINLIKN